MPPSGAPYLIGKLGSYDVATVAKVDGHLHQLRLRLSHDITPRQRSRIWHDLNELLSCRHALASKVPVQ